MTSPLDCLLSAIAFLILAGLGFILVAAGNELGLIIQVALIAATLADLFLVIRSEY